MYISGNRYKIGLNDISTILEIPKIQPRKKSTIMIIGNHSSGKSSFINCIFEFN